MVKTNEHNYVTVGGYTPEWIRAGIKKLTRIDTFP